ncbi:hypothetical protein DS745_20825 [Anaerobacillus alkaliphilus]|uniref:Uncharacterized protein n=1 Tax=Anaerobacillus alkaliphilus TaxID=1548597 RepID=A0A4V1LFR3_9BACI|nr:hypothetical protein [Anaerobacillus alkaliphilus]RXI96189.1 hypothetical protein DS745_20825 [Anaerobacillus alkaliphilus]
MLKDMRAILYYLVIDQRFSFFVFWSIFIASSIFLLAISYTFSINMIVSISMATYIFCGISGFLQTKITFPYSIKLGLTRTRYVIGSFVFNVVLAITMSLFHLIINKLLLLIATTIGATSFSLLTTVNATTLANTWYNLLFVDIVLCTLVFSVGLLLGTVFYRLGLIGGIIAIALATISIFIPATRNWMIDSFVSFNAGQIQFVIPFVSTIAVTVLIFIPIWGMLKNASTTPGVTR